MRLFSWNSGRLVDMEVGEWLWKPFNVVLTRRFRNLRDVLVKASSFQAIFYHGKLTAGSPKMEGGLVQMIFLKILGDF